MVVPISGCVSKMKTFIRRYLGLTSREGDGRTEGAATQLILSPHGDVVAPPTWQHVRERERKVAGGVIERVSQVPGDVAKVEDGAIGR